MTLLDAFGIPRNLHAFVKYYAVLHLFLMLNAKSCEIRILLPLS